jgi:predicted acyl esterase
MTKKTHEAKRGGGTLGSILAAVCLVMATTAQAAPTPTPTLYPGGVWQPGPAQYGSVIVDDVPVTMDDGVVLRGSVAYPTDLASGQRAVGSFPVVIEHTPYVKLGQPVVPNTYLTEHGYIYAVVRARGTGASGGEVEFFSPRDGRDSKALVDWAAHRVEGADGRVALLGCSFPGGLTLTGLAHLGPNSPVKAAIAACIGLSNVNRESLMNAGMMTAGFWNYTVRGLAYWGNSPAGARFVDRFTKEVQAGGDMAYDRDYWRDRAPLRWAKDIVDTGVPVLMWSGWQDILESGAVHLYAALQNAAARRPLFGPMRADQPVSPRYQMIMGNWAHAAGLDAGIYLQWLDTWVKGVDTGIGKTRTPMHMFEAGTNRWVNLSGYPAAATSTAWRFGADGTLSAGAPKDGGSASLAYGDPAQAGSKLSFTTPPLAKGATLAGPISATLYASSSNTNMVLLAKLYDVAPDGKATMVSEGAIVGSQRELDRGKSWTDRRGTVIWPWPKLDRDDYLKPDQVYRFDIALAPRQWGINPDHRLRLELTTQSPSDICPAVDLPPRNVPDPCRLTAPQQATVPGGRYKIMYGPKWQSTLNLPQLPFKAFAEVRSGVPPTAWNENQRRLETRDVTLPLDWGK